MSTRVSLTRPAHRSWCTDEETGAERGCATSPTGRLRGRPGFGPQVLSTGPSPPLPHGPAHRKQLHSCTNSHSRSLTSVLCLLLARGAFVGQRSMPTGRRGRLVLRLVIGFLSGASSRDRQQSLCLLYGQGEYYLISDEPRVLFCVITVQSSTAQSCPVRVISLSAENPVSEERGRPGPL